MEIVRVRSDDQNVDGIIKVYQHAFGGEPWNEGYKCENANCDVVFPLSNQLRECPQCAEKALVSALVEYWPKDEVLSDFKKEMQKQGAICIAALDSSTKSSNEVWAFAWGYDVSSTPSLDEKLESPGLSDLISGTLFYLDECAVSPDYQGYGLGKELVRTIFDQQPYSEVILRTLNDSRMCNLIKHMGGEIILHISRGRVIMKLKVR